MSTGTSTTAIATMRARRRPVGPIATASVVIAALVLWQLGTWVTGASATVLPGPIQILLEANWPTVFSAAVSTTLATLVGFAIGNLVGLLLAVVICVSRTAADIVYPGAIVVRSIPIVALAPFITLVFGRGAGATIVVAALIVFFPTLVNVILGLRSVPREAIELMKVVNASAAFAYLRVRIPFAMPAFVSALKISAPSAVLGVMTAEWIIGGEGLGRLIIQSWLSLQIPTMWGAVVLSAVVAWLLFSAVSLLERMLLGWAVRT